MDILFEVEKQNQFGMELVGIAEEVPVGHVMLHYRGEHALELRAIWLEDKESENPGIQEFAEAFFRHLKNQGYTELWMVSEDMDDGDAFGFRLEERDNSGWYPKYYFHREL